jgi:pyroglutamyl-peptidase
VIRLLVLGFGPYRGIDPNPTELAIRALPPSLSQVSYIFQTKYRDVETNLPALLERHAPTDVLLFGEAPSRNSVNLERLALNRTTESAPDISGESRVGKIVVQKGADSLPSTLPMDLILLSLGRMGFKSVLSDSAGGYVCNFAFYLLQYLTGKSGIKRSGLVHLPNPHNYEKQHSQEFSAEKCVQTIVETLLMKNDEKPGD